MLPSFCCFLRSISVHSHCVRLRPDLRLGLWLRLADRACGVVHCNHTRSVRDLPGRRLWGVFGFLLLNERDTRSRSSLDIVRCRSIPPAPSAPPAEETTSCSETAWPSRNPKACSCAKSSASTRCSPVLVRLSSPESSTSGAQRSSCMTGSTPNFCAIASFRSTTRSLGWHLIVSCDHKQYVIAVPGDQIVVVGVGMLVYLHIYQARC